MATRNILLVLLEGNDDQRFFENVLNHILEKRHDVIKLITFANEKSEKIRNVINAALKMKQKVLIVVDFDEGPCITHVKGKISHRFGLLAGATPNATIIAAKKMIESWYLAGVVVENMQIKRSQRRKINELLRRHGFDTEKIGKEQFNDLIPQNFSRINFMMEMLRCYNVELARKRNHSFAYFLDWIES